MKPDLPPRALDRIDPMRSAVPSAAVGRAQAKRPGRRSRTDRTAEALQEKLVREARRAKRQGGANG